MKILEVIFLLKFFINFIFNWAYILAMNFLQVIVRENAKKSRMLAKMDAC